MAKIYVFLLILITFLTLQAESILTPSKYQCSNSTYSNTTASSYKENLDHVLDSLSSNSRSPLGYYNVSSGRSTSDAVYGSFLCKGDLGPDECQECVVNVTKTILRLCPQSAWAIVWYDHCMIRYSDHDYFSSMETEPYLYGYNGESETEPEKFNPVLEETLRKLVNKLLGVDYVRYERKYAIQEAKATEKETLYTMAQCTPDVNMTGCRKCLETAIPKLQTIEEGKIGGRVMLPSCFVRFEIYPFYGVSSRGKQRLGKAGTLVLIVATMLLFVAMCVVGFLLMQRKCRNGKNQFEKIQSSRLEYRNYMPCNFPCR